MISFPGSRAGAVPRLFHIVLPFLLYFSRGNIGIHHKSVTKKRHTPKSVSQMLAPPIFPGRRQPGIVGRNELNCRVRNGNGWTLVLIGTNFHGATCASLAPGLTRNSYRFAAPLCYPVNPENNLHYKLFIPLCQEKNGDPYRIRTDVNGVRGRCLNHLTNGPRRRDL